MTIPDYAEMFLQIPLSLDGRLTRVAVELQKMPDEVVPGAVQEHVDAASGTVVRLPEDLSRTLQNLARKRGMESEAYARHLISIGVLEALLRDRNQQGDDQ